MRVIAGTLKGRRLQPPSWDGLRPTSDKLRETLFNILSPRMAGARVLDGFAGTGALGIEALSRGAAHVTFIESDRRAAALIEANLSQCGIQAGYTVERGAMRAVMPRLMPGERFDLVLLDPPYAAGGIGDVLLAVLPHVRPDGLIVLEHPSRTPPDVPPSLTMVREVRSGDSTLTFLVASSQLPVAG